MNIKITTKHTYGYVALAIGGGITVMIGLMHFFMPTFGYDMAIPDSMLPDIRNHFYYLGTYAIGGFLLSLGIFSLYLAFKKYADITTVFAIIMVALWSLRTILEFMYPTELSLFILERPVVILLPILALTTLCYLVTLVASIQNTKQ